jgi:NADPH:quinone reductase-like Zn-dependent oxidoreductase
MPHIGTAAALFTGEFSECLSSTRLHLWGAFRFLFGGRRAVWYSITARRTKQPEEFKADMAALFGLLRDGAIHPVVIDRLPLAAAREVHTRIDGGGLGGKIVLMPWPAPLPDPQPATTRVGDSPVS